jgi:hypothetical protein
MEIIVPCAGRSSRFPNMRPKYLLSDYKRDLMIYSAINGLLDRHKVTVTILKEHDDQYDSRTILTETFGDRIKIVVLDQPTSSPAETVVETLARIGPFDGPFLVRDCDSFFSMELSDGNAVYTSQLSANPNLRNVSSLGYVISNEQDVIIKLVEKRVVSDSFCAGAYQFAGTEKFMEAYGALKDQGGELFLSNIIDYLIMSGEVFAERRVSNYVNVGTADAWYEYNDRPTIFCDIDGTIVLNQSAYGATRYDKQTFVPMQKNIEILKRYKARGALIIFITARSKVYYQATREMLDQLGFADCQVIMELHHAKRVVVNDFAPSNPYPVSVAINLERGSDTLGHYLKPITGNFGTF